MTDIELAVRQNRKELKHMQTLGWNEWQRHTLPADQGYWTPECKTWDSKLREQRSLRRKVFIHNVLKAHLRGKIHCRKLTKTDIAVPSVYRDQHSSERFPPPGLRVLRHKGWEILTLEDQEKLLLGMLKNERRLQEINFYASSFQPGEIEDMLNMLGNTL